MDIFYKIFINLENKRKENIYIYIYLERERERDLTFILKELILFFWLCGKESTKKSRINSVQKNY